MSTWRRLAPGLDSMRDLDRRGRRGDLRAAVTVAAIVVPQSLAYAKLAGVPSVHGLYAAIAALVAYSIFGTSRDLNMGAESTVALMTASAVAPVAASGSDAIELTALMALLVGVYSVIGFVLRLGFISDFLSRPILAGYVFGSGVIIVISQLADAVGVEVDEDLYVTDLGAVAANLDAANGATVALSVGTIVTMWLLRRFAPAVPGALVCVVIAVALVVAFDLESRGVAVVGDIERGVPVPRLPWTGLGDFASLLLPALGVALLAYPDSFLTARSLAARGHYEVDADQEFLAIGASNLGSGLLQGIPVNGSQSRSFVQQEAGARSNAAGLMTAALVLVTVLVLAPLFERLPNGVLAGVVIVAGVGLLDLDEFRRLRMLRPIEFWMAVGTVIGVLAFGMLGGIVVAILISLIVVLARVVRPHTAELGFDVDTETYRDVAGHPDAERTEGLLVYRFDDEVFFANASWFRDSLERSIRERPVTDVLIDGEMISDVDATGVQEIGNLIDDLGDDGITVSFARIRASVVEMLRKSGIIERVGEDHVHDDVDDGVRAFLARSAGPGDDAPGGSDESGSADPTPT